MRGVEMAELGVGDAEHTRLLRIAPGTAIPRHTHGGSEVTLILDGGYRDCGENYARGDVQVADPSVDHAPVADEDGPCLCLAVTDARLRLTGPVGRLINPFVKF
jgi:putative transcriptional regulator